MKARILTLLFASLFVTSISFAKASSVDSLLNASHPHIQKYYLGGSLDAGIFSTATIKEPFGGNTTGILRFSYVINYGFSFNFNLSKHFGVFTGIDLKNVGFIEKIGDLTIKRRTYNLGVPVGIKIGNMKRKGAYMFLGGGVDVPVNYKEKEFTQRSSKAKFNEWFSARTPAIMPYVFAGVKIKHGMTFKAQYYPNNFLNPDYVSTKNGFVSRPYYGYDVHLILLSIGFDMHYGKNKDMVKKSVKSLKTNTL